WVSGKKVSFVTNSYNDVAQVFFIYLFGTDHDRELSLATQVLHYLGTDELSAEDLKRELFKLGITNDFRILQDQLTISLAGLEENMPAAISLLKHWMQNAQPDQQVYEENVQTILESREVAKKDKGRIMTALTNYAKYGRESRFRDVLSEERLKQIKSADMTQKIQDLLLMPYQIF